MFNRTAVVFVLAIFAALILGMIINERMKTSNLRATAGETIVPVSEAIENGTEMVRSAYTSGLTEGKNRISKGDLLLLMLEGVKKNAPGCINDSEMKRLEELAAEHKRKEPPKRTEKPDDTPARATPPPRQTPNPPAEEPEVLPPLQLGPPSGPRRTA